MPNHKVIYNGNDISDKIPIKNGLSLRMTHSLVGEDLQVDEADVAIISDGSVNVFVPQAPVEVEYNGNSFGKYYAREQKIKNYRETALTAYSGIWLLKLVVCQQKKYWTDTPVRDVLPDIMGGVPYKLDDDFAEEVVLGQIPAGTGYQQLFEVLLATGGSCRTEPDGTIRIGFPDSNVSSVIDGSKLVLGGVVEKRNPLTYLSVTAYSFTKGTDGKTNSKVYLGLQYVNANDSYIAKYYKYYDEISVGTGASLSQSTGNANFQYLVEHPDNSSTTVILRNITSSRQTAYVFGKEKDIAATPDGITETVISTGVPPTGIDTDNAKMISGHYLINPTNARTILGRLWNYFANQETIKATIICDTERPGDYVRIMRPDTKEMVYATIKSAEYHFGALEHRATIEALIGFAPDGSAFEWTKSMLLTSLSGTVTPAQMSAIAGYEVKRFKVVTVAKGAAGSSGKGGGIPTPTKIPQTTKWVYHHTYNSNVAYYDCNVIPTSGSFDVNSDGGAGGKGGTGDKGGKINTAIISVAQQSDVYNYVINNSSKPSTVFDMVAADNGKNYENGLEIAGYTFGANGSDGVAGEPGKAYNSAGSSTASKNTSLTYNVLTSGTGTGTTTRRVTTTISASKFGKGGNAYGKSAPTISPQIDIDANSGIYGYCEIFSWETPLRDGEIIWDGPRVSIYGGRGATPDARTKAANYGAGGDGGHGGGGAGGIGTVTYAQNAVYGSPMKFDFFGGGSGGAGGEGGDGCILLLF